MLTDFHPIFLALSGLKPKLTQPASKDTSLLSPSLLSAWLSLPTSNCSIQFHCFLPSYHRLTQSPVSPTWQPCSHTCSFPGTHLCLQWASPRHLLVAAELTNACKPFVIRPGTSPFLSVLSIPKLSSGIVCICLLLFRFVVAALNCSHLPTSFLSFAGGNFILQVSGDAVVKAQCYSADAELPALCWPCFAWEPGSSKALPACIILCIV